MKIDSVFLKKRSLIWKRKRARGNREGTQRASGDRQMGHMVEILIEKRKATSNGVRLDGQTIDQKVASNGKTYSQLCICGFEGFPLSKITCLDVCLWIRIEWVLVRFWQLQFVQMLRCVVPIVFLTPFSKQRRHDFTCSVENCRVRISHRRPSLVLEDPRQGTHA